MQGRDKQVKKKELYSYVFWGVLSTILNIGLAQLVVWSGIDYKISNAITLVIVKVFATSQIRYLYLKHRSDLFIGL